MARKNSPTAESPSDLSDRADARHDSGVSCALSRELATVQWAAEQLPPDSYRVEEQRGEPRLRLTRRVRLDGLTLRAGTELELDHLGRLRLGVLDEDCTFDELPLAGGTEVEFDPASGELVRCTLRRPTMLGAVPCAAGEVSVRVGRHRRQAVSATLSRDCQLRGAVEPHRLSSQRLPCRGGSHVTLRPGALHARLITFSPRVDIRCWGFLCAAKRTVDIERRAGTLAEDHAFAAIVLPAGSTFAHAEGALPGRLTVSLARAVSFAAHRLPAGAIVHVDRELVRPLGPWERWQRRFTPPSDVMLRVSRNRAWSIVGLRIPAGSNVDILRDGGVRFRTDRDLVVHGALYPGGSELELTREGFVRRWRAGPGEGAQADHPYRAAATPLEGHPKGFATDDKND